MKQVWTFFVGGLFFVAVVSVLLQNTHAEEGKKMPPVAESGDPRVVKIKDQEISALKTEVPGTTEMESGLVKRQKELDEKAQQIKVSEERLKIEEERLKYKIEELEKLQADLNALDAKGRKYSEEVFKKLVKTFETMNPKKAAGVISVAEDPLAVDLLLAMKEKKVAAILDVMDPTRAVALSSLMAKRKPAGMIKSDGSVDGGQARP